jgi:20S proteasome subunit alpha 4
LPSRYDKNINIFSNQGELLQVDYALNAALKGETTICAKSKEGEIILCLLRKRSLIFHSNSYMLFDRRSVDKVSKIDNNVWVAFSGLLGDGRSLIKQARMFCVSYFSKFGCSPLIGSIAHNIGDLQHEATLLGGRRPFGVQILVIGCDSSEKSFKLFLTNPSGEVTSWKAVAIGKNSAKVNQLLEDKLSDGLKEATELPRLLADCILPTYSSSSEGDDIDDNEKVEFYRFHRSKDDKPIVSFYPDLKSIMLEILNGKKTSDTIDQTQIAPE